jgi:ATP-binding cassette subfamily F protein 3
MEKVEAKLKQKQEKRDNINNSTSQPIYDSSKNASASQSISKKAEIQKDSDSNRSFDIIIENFDISFGNKYVIKINL